MSSALDMVIGAGETQRNAKQASEHARRGEELYNHGDKAGAVAEYRKAAAADPNNSQVFFRLGYLLDLVGEEDEAITMYERACENPPAPINALINLCLLYTSHGIRSRTRSSRACYLPLSSWRPELNFGITGVAFGASTTFCLFEIRSMSYTSVALGGMM